MPKGTEAYRTISEVAKWLGTQSHVLRYWESKFDIIQPMKSSGGRRYYKPEDMQIIGGIRHFLHGEGMTIKALQASIVEHGIDPLIAASPALPGQDTPTQTPVSPENDAVETKQATMPTVQRKSVVPAKKTSPDQQSNVIAFTIDPLPIKPRPAPDPSRDVGQMSLFPELTPSHLDPRPLSAEFTRRGVPDGDRIEEAPMLNLFDEPRQDTPPAPARAIPLSLSRRDRPNSDHPAKPGILTALLALPRSQRRHIVHANRAELQSLLEQ